MHQAQRQHSPFPAGSQPGKLCLETHHPLALARHAGDGAASDQDEQFCLQADGRWVVLGHNRMGIMWGSWSC